MYCPECGNNLNGLEKTCREEFNNKHEQHFHNLRMIRSRQGYWRGLWAGVAFDLLMICLLWGLGGWSWNGFLQIVYRISEKTYLLLFVPFLIPSLCVMVYGVLGSADLDAKEERLYQKFRDTWGLPENTKLNP